MRTDNLIKISEMADLHGVSRQTLILYDKNGLLQPCYVSDTGYRYYSLDQIPRLRQICLLKEMGVPLRQIKEHLASCSVSSMRELLELRRAEIAEERVRLERQEQEVSQLERIFDHVEAHELNVGIPYIDYLPECKAIVAPYPVDEMDEKHLHLALMNAWGTLLEAGMLPSCGFGSVLRTSALDAENPLAGAGSIVFLPRDEPIEGADTVTLPAGEYAIMYKYAMPYDVEPARVLLAWMRERNLVPDEYVIDRCILDSVFYDDVRKADFCRLQIRIIR